jgi:hypothetical protein
LGRSEEESQITIVPLSKYSLKISTSAETEYISSFKFYEDQQSGLGERFEKEAESLMNQIRLNPFLFQRKHKHFREAIFRKFPYLIIYEIKEDVVYIISFYHAKRDPKGKLKRRKS